MVKAKKFILSKHFKGLPKANDLQLKEEELPPIKDGEFLAEAVYLSVDPYIKGYSSILPIGTTLIGSQVAKIIESKNPKYPEGRCVVGEFGWRTHTIVDDTPHPFGFPDPWLIPDSAGLPLSLSLGTLGAIGNTAYFGFLDICKPQPGETVVVSTAAGAVGSIVGQIAKIKGCTVIGITSSEEKGKWLVKDLKFDHFLNYKDKDFAKKLGAVTPKGIDCYFDNVGGEITMKIINKMNTFGRVSLCGAISIFNSEEGGKGNFTILTEPIQSAVVSKQLKIEGFSVLRFKDRWFEGIEQNQQWIKEGKMKYRETLTEGFKNTFGAFVDMLEGRNIGKSVVKV